MKVDIQSIQPHPQGVVFGLLIKHEKAGWIRFSTTVLLTGELSADQRALLYQALNRAEQRSHSVFDADELQLDWGGLD